MRRILLFIFFLFAVHSAFATTYYSEGSLALNTLANWNSNRDGTSGSTPANFTTAGDIFVIQGTGGGGARNDAMTLGTTLTIGSGANNTKLQIEGGASLTCTSALTFGSAGQFQLDANATYNHGNTTAYGTSIFAGVESFASTSTVNITSSSTTGPTSSNVTGGFGNLIYNASATCQMNAVMPNVNGNLTVTQGTVRLCGSVAGNASVTIGGNLTINGGTFDFGNGTVSGFIVNLGGNFTFSSGTLTHAITGGTSGSHVFGFLNFTKTGTQTFNKSGGTITATASNFRDITFTVNSGAILDMGTSVLDALVTTSLNFTLSSGAGLVTANLNGITSGNTASGSIQNLAGTRTFSTGADYTFNGGGAQATGTGFTGANNLTINNSSGVTLTSSSAIAATLTLMNGALAVGSNTLTLNSSVSVTSGSLTSSSNGTVSYNQGSNGQSVIAATYGNLTLSNFNKTLASSGTIGIAGTFTPGSGTPTITGSTLDFNNSTGGQTVPAFNYNNLTVSNSSGATTLASSGTVGVAGTFTPGSGSYTTTGSTVDFNKSTGGQTIPAFNYNNLTISNGSGTNTLSGSVGVAAAFTPGSNAAAGSSTVNFNGTAAQSIPAFSFNNLTISGNKGGGAVTLVNGGTIGVAGSLSVTATNTSYTNTGNTVDFNGTSSQSIGALNFNNLTVSGDKGGGTVTLVNGGTIGVAGAFTTSASNVSYTVTANTVDFNGSGTQNIGAFTFNNLSASAGGTKTATGALVVGGTLTVASLRTLDMGTNALSGALTTSGTGILQTQNITATPLPSGKTWTMDVEYNSASDQTVMTGTYAKLSALAGGTKTPDGAVTTNGNFVVDASTTLSAGSFTHTVKGNWSNSGTLTAGTSRFKMQGSALQTMSGSTFYDLEIDNASGVNMLTNETVSNSLILTSGVFDANGNTLTVQAGATVNRVAGSLDEAPTYGAGVNVTYSGTGSVTSGQELTPGAGSMNTLAVTGSGGTYTLASQPTIDHFSISSGATLVAGTNVITTSTASTVTGTLKTANTSGLASTVSGSTITLASGSTVEFNSGSAQTVDGRTDYSNLVLSAAGAKSISSGIEIAGNFTVSGGTATPPATMTFDGTTAQSIAGLTYQTVAFNGNGNKTFNSDGSVSTAVTFASGQAATIDFDGTGNDKVFTVKSTAAYTARIENKESYTLNGSIKAERYYPSRRAWRLMSAPVSATGSIYSLWQNGGINSAGIGTLITGPGANPGTNGLDASTQNTTTLYTYNQGGNAWAAVSNTMSANVSDNAAYFIFIRGDRNTNNLNIGTSNTTTLHSTGAIKSGDQQFTTNTGTGYTLLGNPFPSPVDFNAVWTDAANGGGVGTTNVLRKFYTYDPNIGDRGGYVTVSWNGGSYDVVPSSGVTSQTQHIQSGQGFFVEADGSANTNQLTLKESHKSSSNINNVFRAGTQFERLAITLKRTNTDASIVTMDGILANFHNGNSAGVGSDDASKFTNFDESISFRRDGHLLSIEAMPLADVNDTLFLNIANMKQRSYQFIFEPSSFNAPGLIAYLEDAFTGTTTQLSLSAATPVTFTVTSNAATSAADRFRIVFKNNNPLPVSFVNVKAYEKNAAIQVEWNIASESGVNRYEVEESSDAINFSKSKLVQAKANNNTAVSYSWLDNTIVAGANYYRIRSIGNNGEIKLSPVVKVNIGKGSQEITIYPNPVRGGSFSLQMNNFGAGNYTLDIYSIAGQKVMTRSFNHTGGSGTQSFVLDKQVRPGVYQLVVQNGKADRMVQTIIIND
jgi:hypothetical protein